MRIEFNGLKNTDWRIGSIEPHLHHGGRHTADITAKIYKVKELAVIWLTVSSAHWEVMWRKLPHQNLAPHMTIKWPWKF